MVSTSIKLISNDDSINTGDAIGEKYALSEDDRCTFHVHVGEDWVTIEVAGAIMVEVADLNIAVKDKIAINLEDVGPVAHFIPEVVVKDEVGPAAGASIGAAEVGITTDADVNHAVLVSFTIIGAILINVEFLDLILIVHVVGVFLAVSSNAGIVGATDA